MKLSLRLIVLVLGILFIPVQINAQTIKPLIDFAIVDDDNPIVAFDTAAIIVHVKILNGATNADTGNFSGNLKFSLQTDKMGDVDEQLKLYIDNDPAYEYMPIGGKFDTLWFPVDTGSFRTGSGPPINVIIIWPAFINPSLEMVDSGETILFGVPGYIGLEEEPIQQFGSTVFPNPAEAIQLVFLNSKYTQDISSITIMNSLGQTMSIKEFAEGENSKGYVLATEDLQAGIYHIHIVYKDKKREVVKFIKN